MRLQLGQRALFGGDITEVAAGAPSLKEETKEHGDENKIHSVEGAVGRRKGGQVTRECEAQGRKGGMGGSSTHMLQPDPAQQPRKGAHVCRLCDKDLHR